MPRTRGRAAGGTSIFTTGTYTGNGAATQAIAGIGFRPRFVVNYPQQGGGVWDDLVTRTQGDTGDSGHYLWANSYHYNLGWIISLDADGFTVASFANTNGVVYTYIAWR